MNAVIALFSNFSMNSDSVPFPFFPTLLIYRIPIYAHNLPFLFAFLSESRILSSVYFIPTLILSFYISWRPGVAYISLFHSIHVSLSLSSALLSVVFARFTLGTWTRSLNCLCHPNPHIFQLCVSRRQRLSGHRTQSLCFPALENSGGLNLFYTLREDHAPSNLVYNLRFDLVISRNIFLMRC